PSSRLALRTWAILIRLSTRLHSVHHSCKRWTATGDLNRHPTQWCCRSICSPLLIDGPLRHIPMAVVSGLQHRDAFAPTRHEPSIRPPDAGTRILLMMALCAMTAQRILSPVQVEQGQTATGKIPAKSTSTRILDSVR